MEIEFPRQVQIRVDLVRIQRISCNLRLQQRAPRLATPGDDDEPIGSDRLAFELERDLDERLDLPRRCPERLQQRVAKLWYGPHDRKQS